MSQDHGDRNRSANRSGDEEIAREANAMGEAGISRSTGTGSAGSGLAAGGRTGSGGTSHGGTTGATTNESDDLADAAGPSGVQFGGTGTAGSGLGAPTNVGVPPEAGTDSGTTASDAAGTQTAGRTMGNRGTTGGGSAAGGGGR